MSVNISFRYSFVFRFTYLQDKKKRVIQQEQSPAVPDSEQLLREGKSLGTKKKNLALI